MPSYKITTLVDITRTNPHRSETDRLKLAQQANFNSLLQAIGLRANPEWTDDPVMHSGRLPDPFQGKGNHWTWTFSAERDRVFEKGSDPVGLLKDDLDSVPIIGDLKNTLDLDPSAFFTRGSKQNTHIEICN